jgi:hypothetical protein
MQNLDGSQTPQMACVDEDTLSMYTPPQELQPFSVQDAPQGTFYIPNFIDGTTEETLLMV